MEEAVDKPQENDEAGKEKSPASRPQRQRKKKRQKQPSRKKVEEVSPVLQSKYVLAVHTLHAEQKPVALHPFIGCLLVMNDLECANACSRGGSIRLVSCLSAQIPKHAHSSDSK